MAEFILAHAGPGILAAATTACSLPSTPACAPKDPPSLVNPGLYDHFGLGR